MRALGISRLILGEIFVWVYIREPSSPFPHRGLSASSSKAKGAGACALLIPCIVRGGLLAGAGRTRDWASGWLLHSRFDPSGPILFVVQGLAHSVAPLTARLNVATTSYTPPFLVSFTNVLRL